MCSNFFHNMKMNKIVQVAYVQSFEVTELEHHEPTTTFLDPSYLYQQ